MPKVYKDKGAVSKSKEMNDYRENSSTNRDKSWKLWYF